jgi:hypothetical protein
MPGDRFDDNRKENQMTTFMDKAVNSMGMFLPEILPADPCAPETIKHKPRGLKYGLIGKIFMAFDARHNVPAADETRLKLQRDVALHECEAFGGVAGNSWNAPATWRRPLMPERFGHEAMQLFSQPRAL